MRESLLPRTDNPDWHYCK